MTSDLNDPLALHYEFGQLSVSDLLKARDTYHFHLLNKANVIGTAVGYYLIRAGDPTPEQIAAGASRPTGPRPPRTLTNSEVRDYSWPCVLVLVSQWTDEEQFGAGGTYNPTKMVPKTLFMPDGQAVPVCVVEADEPADPGSLATVTPDVPPAWKLGGGLPITVTAQCVDYTATAGCLVSDGHYTYALTAGHVCGDPGTIVSSQLRGREIAIGQSSAKQLTRVPFSTVYPDFPGRRSYSALDAGLIRLDDLTQWTSNIYGLPPLHEMEDVHEHNLSLRLIDRRVVGYGAGSGLVRGTIKALFYRYKSVGGFDYVGDFLISPDDKGNGTRHGDSGMIWNLDLTADPAGGPVTPLQQRYLKPLAMQWGGQVFIEGDKRSAFAVATSLSNVCRLLNIEPVNTLSRGVSGYWGRIGHYSIAAFAVQLVDDPRLKAFLQANIDLLSFDLTVIEGGKKLEHLIAQLGKADKFIPLADVPDEVWKKLPATRKGGRTGGRDTRATPPFGSEGPEHPNHYADIDDPLPDGTTWRAQCLADNNNITVAAWQQYYQDTAARCAANGETALAKQYGNPLHQGLLPLRVWQIFDTMVASVTSQNIVDFLTAAGVCAHYVGDACQPLHGSILADGDPRQIVGTDPKTGQPLKFAQGVHSAYESAMVSRKAKDLVERISAELAPPHNLALCRDGQAAARATLTVMDEVAGILPPRTILTSFENNGANALVATLDGMWGELGDQTVEVMLVGAKALAMIWDSAWKLGNGNDIGGDQLVAVDEGAVRTRYIDDEFVPSRTLDEIGPLLT
jgi:hypothetical protein